MLLLKVPSTGSSYHTTIAVHIVRYTSVNAAHGSTDTPIRILVLVTYMYMYDSS